MGVIAKQSIIATIISYSGAFIGFLTTFFILTAFLTPEEIGLTRVLLETANLLSAIGMLGMSTSIYRFFPYFKERVGNPPKHHGFYYHMIRVALVGCIGILLLYLLLRTPLSAFFGKNSALFVHYYYAVVPLTVFLLFWLVFELYAVQMMHLIVPKFIREIVLRILLIGVYLIYAIQWVSLNVTIILFVLVYGICMMLSYYYLNRVAYTGMYHEKNFLTPALKHDFLRYTALYVLASFGTTLASRMDLFMISSLDSGGLNSAGIFSIAFFIIAVIEIPSRSLLNISTPRMAEAMKQNNIAEANRIYRQVALYQLLTGGIIFLLIWFNIRNVFAIIPNGHLYTVGIPVVLFLGLAKLIEITFNFSHPIVSCSRYYHWNLYYTGIVTLVSILLNIQFIHTGGIVGAAQATLLTMLFGYGVQQFLVMRFLHIHPFSFRMLRLLGVFAIIILINPLLPTLSNPWTDILMRGSMLLVVSLLGIYLLRVSPEWFEHFKKCKR